ncbi:MAG: hypothetical protein WC560_12755 [Syntrophales bacterium]
MKLKAENKRKILEEFDYAARTMREVQTLDEKLFYFSSTFGALSRVFNSDFDSQLVFMHLVLANAHATILGRVQAMRAGDSTIVLKEDFFEKLTNTVDDLINRIRDGQDVYDVLEKIAVLTYVTTGNGYYLLRKGTIPTIS